MRFSKKDVKKYFSGYDWRDCPMEDQDKLVSSLYEKGASLFIETVLSEKPFTTITIDNKTGKIKVEVLIGPFTFNINQKKMKEEKEGNDYEKMYYGWGE